MRKFSGFAAWVALAAFSLGGVTPQTARAEDEDGGDGDEAPPGFDVAAWVSKVIEALRTEQPGALVRQLGKGSQKALVTSPKESWRLASAAAKYVPRWGVGEYSDRADRIAKWIAIVGESVVKLKPQDPLAKRASAAAHATKARLDVVRGSQVAPDEWVIAADLVVGSYATDAGADGGEAAGLAVGWLRDAAELQGMDLSALSDKVGLLAKVLEPLPAAPVADLARAQVQFVKAMVVPAQAKASMDAFFAIMAPYAKPGCEVPIATLYNEGVTYAKSKKLASKYDYLMAAKNSNLTNLTYQLIHSEHFKTFTGDDRILGGFDQFDQYGRRIRKVSVELFRWDYKYTVDDKSFGGAEAKGLARLVQGFLKDDFSKIDSPKKELTKAMFAKGMPASESFELRGTDAKGQPLRVRVHFVKGKEAPATYGITIRDFGTLPEGDPEMKEVLDTLTEVKKK